MRKIAVIAAISCIMPLVHAQKIVEKTFNFNNKSSLAMDVQISDSISIQTWNRNEVYVYATININDNKDNEAYQTSFNESGNRLEINGRFQNNYFSGNNCHNKANIAWIVKAPENADISVKTINGNIIITGKTNTVNAQTISGFIDMGVPADKKADLRMKTITGNIYTDLNFATNTNKRVVELNIDQKLNGGGAAVILETISGDIFLRKK